MRSHPIRSVVLAVALMSAACNATDTASTTTPQSPPVAEPTSSMADASAPTTVASPTTALPTEGTDGCGHDVDPTIVELGFNEVVDAGGAVKAPQGRPFEEGDTLRRSTAAVTAANGAAYAQVAALMMPIRDALMCDIATTPIDEWDHLTEVLDVNGIKTVQDLSGTPPEQVYSSDGIYELLRTGEDFNAMMKYLEEAELELKCLAFVGFDFTNPEGDNHCEIHGLAEGSGIVLP